MAGEAAWSAWQSALGRLGHARVVQVRPPRWRVFARAAAIDVTLADDGTHTIEVGQADESSPWRSLLVLPRDEALESVADLVSGDAALDRAARVACEDVAAYGLLDAATRAALVALVAARGRVEGTLVRVWAEDAEPGVLDAMLVIRERLELGSDGALGAIGVILQHDPLVTVKRRMREVAKDPAVFPFVPAHLVALSAEESFLALADTASDGMRAREVRRHALKTLLELFEASAVAAIEGIEWRDFAHDEVVVDALAAALERAPQVAVAHVVGMLLAMNGGDLKRAELPDRLVECLCDGLAALGTRTARQALAQLAGHYRHRTSEMASAAFLQGVGRFSELMPLLLDDDALVWELDAAAALWGSLRRRALSVVTDPGGREEAAERAAARAFVRRYVATGTTPLTSAEMLQVIASHRRDEDVEGFELLRAQIDHDSEAVRIEALAAVIALFTPAQVREALDGVSDSLLVEASRRAPPEQAAHALALGWDDMTRPHERRAIGELLVRVATTREQGALIAMIEDDEAGLRERALEALARVGDMAAIDRVAVLATGVFRSGRLKDAARATMRAIRERLAPDGALALSEDGGGLALDGEDER